VLDALMRALRLPDLRNKVLFTFAMLVVFRVFAHIPVPGVDPTRLAQLLQTNQLMGMLDLFSGGAMTTFSIAVM
jgi:preprotein translocase subunit SecY